MKKNNSYLRNVLFLFGILSSALINSEIGVKPLGKIHYQNNFLKNLSLDVSESEKVTVTNDEKVNVVIKLDYELFDSLSLLDDDNAQQSKNELLSQGREYYSKKNKELMNNINTERMNDLYVSRYSPFISFNVDSKDLNTVYEEDLETLSKKAFVESINIYNNKNYRPMMSANKPGSGVTEVANTYNVTGKGVKVGMLECGILDKNNANFTGKTVVARNQLLVIETVTDHATAVASVIGGINNGIAPDCSIYSVQLVGGDPINEIEWLLDQKVDVINMSYGDSEPNGIYSNDSAYMDFVANTYKTIFVAAIGNDGFESNYVANPALGYNVFGVGACDYKSPVPFGYSPSKVEKGPDKPSITAPGNALTIANLAGTFSGTSFSSAFVTGCVALMLEYRPALKLHPERVYALLTANARTSLITSDYVGLRTKAGAGGLSITKVFKNIDNIFYGTVTSRTAYEKSIELSIDSGHSMQVAAYWLAYADGNANNTKHTDYDLFLIDSSPSYVLKARSYKNNFEYFEWKCNSSDDYILSFDLAGEMVQSPDQFCVAYCIN